MTVAAASLYQASSCTSVFPVSARKGLWPGGRHTLTVMSPLPVRGGWSGGVSRQENTQISKTVRQNSFARGVPGSRHRTHSWLNTVSSFSQTSKRKNESGRLGRFGFCLSQRDGVRVKGTPAMMWRVDHIALVGSWKAPLPLVSQGDLHITIKWLRSDEDELSALVEEK